MRIMSAILLPGDRVLIRNTETGGPGKIRSCWEEKIYRVVRQLEDWPVYEVSPEDGKGRSRTVIRNMLTQCDELPLAIPDAPRKTDEAKPGETRQDRASEKKKHKRKTKPVEEVQKKDITHRPGQEKRKKPRLTKKEDPKTNKRKDREIEKTEKQVFDSSSDEEFGNVSENTEY